MKVSIIGLGSSGIFCLKRMAAQLTNKRFETALTSITIYTSKNEFITGNAFASHDALNDAFLLNTRSSLLDEFFPNWQENEVIYQDNDLARYRYAQFPPRALFGKYLKHEYELAVAQFKKHEIPVNIIAAEATDITKLATNFSVSSANGTLHFDAVFLCVGANRPLPQARLNLPAGIRAHSIYKTDLATIPSNHRVAIIGTRLTAIDALKALIRQGHQGKIVMVSRTGRLPRVQGNFTKYKMKIFTPEKINELINTKNLRLKYLYRLLKQELALAPGNYKQVLRLMLSNEPTTIETFKAEVFESADRVRVWQNILTILSTYMEHVWVVLDPRDQQKFMSLYASRWLGNMVGIPISSAFEILLLLQSGQLEIKANFKQIQAAEDKGALICCADESILVDDVIDCTEAGTTNVEESHLLKNMIAKNLAKPTAFGGLEVDWHSLRIKQANKTHPIFCVGHLAIGSNFISGSIETNFYLANKAVDGMVEYIIKPIIKADTVFSAMNSNERIQSKVDC